VSIFSGALFKKWLSRRSVLTLLRPLRRQYLSKCFLFIRLVDCVVAASNCPWLLLLLLLLRPAPLLFQLL